MKKTALVALLLALASAASSQAAPYFKVSAFYAKPDDVKINSASALKASLQSNMGFSGAFGYKFSLLRVEGELQTLNSSTSGGSTSGGSATVTGKLKELTGFANGLVDLPSFLGVAPYVGAGLGYARVDLGTFSAQQGTSNPIQIAGKDTAFAYQGMLGIQLHILGQATINAGYRIVDRGDVSLKNITANAKQNVKLGTNQLFEVAVSLGF
jgi:opacity protein-like surface antigen